MLTAGRTVILSFVFALTLLIAFVPPQANASPSPAVVAPAHRRQVNRMIRKRQDLGIIGAGADPGESSTSSTETATTSTDTGTETSTSTGGVSAPITTTTTSSSTTSTESTSSIPSTESTSTEATSSQSTATSQSTSSTASSEPTSSATPTTSQSIEVTPAPDVAALSSSGSLSRSTITNTLTAAQESATEGATAQGASSSVSKTTITVIAVVGGSIAGIAIIWTIIRKWKFRPSSQFEDRMQPIDWSPTQGDGLNRSASNASHGSFHSGSDHDVFAARQHNPNGTSGLVADLPSHDFTAGPAHLGGGYADLQRGPSPAPQMESVARGQSFNRGYGY